jgi:hypothetical protein
MRFIYLLVALLSFQITWAQNRWGKITYPVYGSVMQGTSSSSNSIDVCFQVFNPSLDWRITLFQFDLGGTESRYTVSVVGNYNRKALTDPSLGFSSSSVGNNTSYSHIRGKLNNLSKKQYVLLLHVGTDIIFSVADIIAIGVGDVYYIAGQSNAAGYNVFSKDTWATADNMEGRRGLFDFSNTDDSTLPMKPIHSNNGDMLTRSLDFNGRFDFWASVFDASYKTPDISPAQITELNIKSRNYNKLSPMRGNWLGLPYGRKYSRLKNGSDKLTNPVHIFPNGQASWYWALLGQKIAWNNNTIRSFGAAGECSKVGSEYPYA